MDLSNLTEMKDSDLNLLIQKCLEQLGKGTDLEASKAALQILADEKRFRAAKLMHRNSTRWAIVALLGVIIVGLVQAAAILWLGYSQPPADEENSCDPPEYSAQL